MKRIPSVLAAFAALAAGLVLFVPSALGDESVHPLAPALEELVLLDD